MPDLGVRLDFDINAPIVIGREELRLRANMLQLRECVLRLRERVAKRSDYIAVVNFRRWGGMIFVFMLIFFNNRCVVWATSTLSHYHTKKCVEWHIARKKYNIYYVYNYILPQYPLKHRRF